MLNFGKKFTPMPPQKKSVRASKFVNLKNPQDPLEIIEFLNGLRKYPGINNKLSPGFLFYCMEFQNCSGAIHLSA